MDNVVYKINATDNVATALTSFKHGETANIRGAEEGVIDANEEIHIGHKIALSLSPKARRSLNMVLASARPRRISGQETGCICT